MLNRVIIVLGFLVGSILAAWGASSTLSGLNAGGSISGSDLFYDVQTPGVGGVKVTGTQFLSFVYGNVSGACSATANGVFTCNSSSTGTVGIGAGNNITTSGTALNVTVNVVATPTFSSITTTLASITGWLTAAGVNAQTETIAGALIGSTANFSGNLTGTTAQFIGTLTGTSAVFQTVTINNLTPTGPNCLQETSGVVQATNASCGTGSGSTSIAAGTNITTSGTAINITVNTTLTPTFTNLTVTNAGSIAALTGSNLNFVSGTITTLTNTNHWTTNLTATNAGSIAALTGSNINFVSGTITTLTNTNHWTTSLTSTNGSITTLTGGSATFQTVTINSLTPTGPNCLQETGGVLQATNAACSASVTTPKGGPILPSSEYLGGASGLLFPNFYIPNTNTSGAGAFEGIGYIATTTIATATLQFNMPETIPTGNARLRILQMANASTGSVQYTVSDAVTSPSNSLGTVTLNFEGVTSVAQTVADQLIEKKILLTVTPTSNQIMSIVIGTTSGVAQTITYQPSIVWE